MATATKIRNLRKQKGLTQEELAQMSGTTKQNIYKYEKGLITNIPIEKIKLIAKALGTSAAYLMELTDNPQPVRNEITTERLSALGFDMDKLSKLDENDLLIIRSTLTSLIDTLFQRKK